MKQNLRSSSLGMNLDDFKTNKTVDNDFLEMNISLKKI